MKVLMTLVLVLLLTGCAAGQGWAGRTPAEETTASGTEDTRVQEGAGGLKRPPESTLSYGGQEVKGQLGSYSWSSGRSVVYSDSTGPPVRSKQKTLTVPSGSEMVFRYGGQNPPKTVEAGAYSLNKLKNPNPKGGVYRYDHKLNTQGSGVQRTIPAEMPPGEYVLDVSVKEQQGGAD